MNIIEGVVDEYGEIAYTRNQLLLAYSLPTYLKSPTLHRLIRSFQFDKI
ncbi:MAG: hypothetical protein LBC74_12665 [Planctomycetaceae bacterium]|nr:hypothetical protein [Planctomycetaceae bacterium]